MTGSGRHGIPPDVSPFFIEKMLEHGGTIEIRLTTGSMSPMLPAGSTLRIKRHDPETLRLGSIVVFKRCGTAISHRVTGISRDENGKVVMVRTKGDASCYSDEPVSVQDLLAVVVESNGPFGRLDHTRGVARKVDALAALVLSNPVFNMARRSKMLKEILRALLRLVLAAGKDR